MEKKIINGIDAEHDFCVKIPFRITNGKINEWNKHCASAIEMFGLPGEKYTCRLTPSNIEFWFLEEKDAMVFELCCG